MLKNATIPVHEKHRPRRKRSRNLPHAPRRAFKPEDCSDIRLVTFDDLNPTVDDDNARRLAELSEPARRALFALAERKRVAWQGRGPALNELTQHGFVASWKNPDGKRWTILTWHAAETLDRECDIEGGFTEPAQGKHVYLTLDDETPAELMQRLMAAEERRRRAARLKGGIG